MSTVDMTHRKLDFPPRFLPYLEKHRIFELFHELVELLVQEKPRDHIQFLKKMLPCAAMKKDKQRIVFLSPPGFDRKIFSEILSECLGIPLVNRMYLEWLTRERFKKEVEVSKGEETAEEESCICPGENDSDYLSRVRRAVSTSTHQARQIFFHEAPSEESETTFEVDDYDEDNDDDDDDDNDNDDDEEKARKKKDKDKKKEKEDDDETKEVPDEACICVCPCEANEEFREQQHKKVIEDAKKEKNKDKEKDESDIDEEEEEKDFEKPKDKDKYKNKDEDKSKDKDKGKDEGKGKEKQKVEEKKDESEESEEKSSEKESEKEEQSEEENEYYEFGGELWELPCIPRLKHKRKKEKTDTSVSDLYQQTEETTTSIFELDLSLLAQCEFASKGWILQDIPITEEEANKLAKLGVLPTHAIRIIVNEEEEEENREYRWIVMSWTKIYRYVPVLEVKMNDRTISQFAADMCRLLSGMPHRHAPMLPRIALIGSRGSGVTTQAQKLAKKYGMVHVEFETVIAKALQQDDDIIKLYKQQLATRVEPEVEAVILEKALLTTACRNRGWVLTGYPRNIDQIRMLDIMVTPPNRIIFLEVPPRECFVRLYYRKFDPCLGDEYKIPTIQPFGLDSYVAPDLDPDIVSRLLTHPKNNKKQIVHDIESYFIEKKDMMAYCGKTASYVDGNKTVDIVFELIEKIIIDPAPPYPPRDPLVINYGIDESYRRLKRFRLSSGMFFNNLVLNPPENSGKFLN